MISKANTFLLIHGEMYRHTQVLGKDIRMCSIIFNLAFEPIIKIKIYLKELNFSGAS